MEAHSVIELIELPKRYQGCPKHAKILHLRARAKTTKKTRWLPLFAVAIYGSRKSYKFEAEGFYMKNV
jgi:hypothetical protein